MPQLAPVMRRRDLRSASVGDSLPSGIGNRASIYHLISAWRLTVQAQALP
ncbi:MAG: hypothetical protein HC784_09250 [Hydrococcus sp. CSU_1_8]|nr:hypothetical protein [Hydrococcus sp. CSU_1_8]